MKKQSCFLIVFFIITNCFSFNVESPTLTLKNKDSLTYYVIAKSGLNYRDSPKGKVLGKLPINTEVTIITRTGVFQDIIDEGKSIRGEWVGINKDAKTVYVFDAFLSTKKYTPKLDVYIINSYEKDESGTTYGQITLTDGYPWDRFDTRNFDYLEEHNIDYSHLTKHYKTRFLKEINIKNTDKVYIYNYFLDTLYTYNVSDLPLITTPDPYTGGAFTDVNESDVIGLDLGDKLDLNNSNNHYYESYVYIGEHNPFVKGEMKPIVWEEVDESYFPSTDFTDLESKYSYCFRDNELEEITSTVARVFRYKLKGYSYYLKVFERGLSYIVVLSNNKVVFKDLFTSSEGASPAPISIKNNEENYFEQWTGQLFKNKPPVIFGFMYYSFSCSRIDFLDKTEPTIWELCDCRH